MLLISLTMPLISWVGVYFVEIACRLLHALRNQLHILHGFIKGLRALAG